MNQFVSELQESGIDAFVETKLTPEYSFIKTGSRSHKVLGYRIEGVALVLN